MKIEVIGARGKYTGDLLSAAPDLLDACRCALADLEGLAEAECFSLGDPAHLTIKELRAAIAKATGDAQ
jgi:nucleoside-diphosphate-sugar epimerase